MNANLVNARIDTQTSTNNLTRVLEAYENASKNFETNDTLGDLMALIIIGTRVEEEIERWRNSFMRTKAVIVDSYTLQEEANTPF